ncbi:MAG: Sb-PDE family phosphodiesterase [Pseudomonadales bacterium]
MNRWMPVAAAAALLILITPTPSWPHGQAEVDPGPYPDRPIRFPDAAGLHTLVVDLHSHSVFSDGHVWPKIRVEEALRDGLDALAITDHLEYQPHLADIPHPDRNRAFQEAAAAAEGSDLIVIAGSEITRELPAGHINAVFIDDANALFKVDEPPADPAATIDYYRAAQAWPPEAAVSAANDQGAFVFINHPDWTRQRPSGIAELTPLHRSLIDQGLLHGIEVANGQTFSAEALALGLAHGLTLLGVSDVHDLIDWDYPPAAGEHRPVTLVLAMERTAAGIRSALFSGRTVVWFRNRLIGRPAELQPLLAASLQATDVHWVPDTETLSVTLVNHSDARFELRNVSELGLAEHDARFDVPPHGRRTLTLRPGARGDVVEWTVEVQNAITAPDTHPTLTLRLEPR